MSIKKTKSLKFIKSIKNLINILILLTIYKNKPLLFYNIIILIYMRYEINKHHLILICVFMNI